VPLFLSHLHRCVLLKPLFTVQVVPIIMPRKFEKTTPSAPKT
jgi:hypothetical protein